MPFRSAAQRKAAFAKMGLKDVAAVGGLGAVVGAKLYLLHKYLQWRKAHAAENQPGYNNRRVFAKLPKRKQRAVIYDRRATLRDMEKISYGAGYTPRTRQAAAERSRWRFGG